MRTITYEELAERDLTIEEIIGYDWPTPELEQKALDHLMKRANGAFPAIVTASRHVAEALKKFSIAAGTMGDHMRKLRSQGNPNI